MIASPSARAVASTAAAITAGRTTRREIVHITRQRLTPSAAAPSVQPRGTARRASAMIAIMIGAIITVRIITATIRLSPFSWTTLTTDSLRSFEMNLAMNGTIDEDPDQAVDDRRDGGQQAHDRLDDPLHARRARTRR